MSNTYQVYGIGNALVDKEFEVTDEFFAKAGIEKGLMTLIEEDQHHTLLDKLTAEFGLKKQACGGSAANSIIAAQYFGAKTFYSCNVANDDSGDFYMQDLASAGVDSNLGAQRPKGITGKCLVMVTPDAERTMNTFLGITADFNEQHLDESALSQSEYLYIEGYLVTGDRSRHAAIKAKQLARQHNVKVAMTFSDPAMVQYFKPQVAEVLAGGVDLLFGNDSEAMLWAETDQLEHALESLKQVAKQFVITRGSEGALLFDGNDLIEIAPYAVDAKDTNGAGDMFAGAFLYGLTQGHSFEDCGRLASRAAAQVVAQFGPRLEAAQHGEIKQEILASS